MPEATVEQLFTEALRQHRIGRVDEAEVLYRRVLAQRGDHLGALVNLGSALATMRRFEEAVACFERVPNVSQAQNNLGNALRELGRMDEAIAAYQLSRELAPHDPEPLCNLGSAFKDVGRIDEAIGCYRAALAARPDFQAAHSNLIYAMAFHPACDDRMILDACRAWNARFGAEPRELRRPRTSGRLRIGYVGENFYDHCQAFFLTPVFHHHDRDRFEVHCYASVRRPDSVTDHLRQGVEHWHDVLGMSDEPLAERIRGDRIDILVDLTMHMAGCRLGVFARRAAPVQVAWLAYPGTTGLAAMDDRLTDPVLDPPDGEDAYAERSVRLETFWCYDPLCSEPGVSELPAERNAYITFGCLNNFCKVNAVGLRLWARVLKRVPGSRLLLLAPEGRHRAGVVETLQGQGVHADRVEFVAPRPRPAYLALYHRIDLCLDTLPYNGHTTNLDAMWMGVPVVTRVGRTVVGRAGASQLTNLGLPELIAADDDAFVQAAAELAADLPRLAELRQTLRSRMERSLLMDGARFTRTLESAFLKMAGRACSGAP